MRRVAAAIASMLIPGLAAGALGPLYGGHLRLAVPHLPDSLAPARAAHAGDRLAAGLVHETLVRFDRDGRAPGVAARWSAAAAGREWRLELSPRARFHDGAPVRTADVLRSLRRYLRAESTAAAVLAERLDGGLAFRSGKAAELPGVTAGSASVVLRMSHPGLRPLAPLAAAAAAITGARGAGCGPFAPAVFEPGRRLELAAAADHPAGRPFLDGIRLRVTGAPGRAAHHGEATAERLLLVLDVNRPPFDDAGRRAALVAGFDRETLTARFFPGARPATALFGETAPPPAPAAAPIRGPTAPAITLAVARNVPQAASRRVMARLAAAGLEVTVRPRPPAAARSAHAEARLFLWAPEVAEPGLALREAATLTRVPPGVERALRRAERERDPALRQEQLDGAHRELLADAALIPLAAVPVAMTAPAPLRGAWVDPSGTLRLDDAWLVP